MSQSGAKLLLDRLSFGFSKTPAVNNINLAIAAGEFVSLLGPSGCGKTTTLRLIAGLLKPSAGIVAADGREISSPSRVVPPDRRGMSMIFQSYALWPHMTVAQNIAFGLKLRKASAGAIRETVSAVLKIVRLTGLEDRYPSDLSGGQQQRVALARALALKPSILLFDEPLSNLDATLREEMREEIRRTHDSLGMTSIYVTHDQSEALSISDRIAVLNNGRIEQLDTPQTVYECPKTAFVANFLGKTNILRGRRKENGVFIEGVTVALEASRIGNLAAGDVTVSIRPQHIQIRNTEERPAANGICGLIVTRRYLGGGWEYQVHVKDREAVLRVLGAADESFSIGAEVGLVFDSAKIVILENI